MMQLSETILMFLLNYVIHSTVLITLIYLLHRSKYLRALKTREMLWKFALVGGFITAGVQFAFGLGFFRISTHSNILSQEETTEISTPLTNDTAADLWTTTDFPLTIAEPFETATTINWWWLSLIVIGTISLGSLAFFLMRRRYFLRALGMKVSDHDEVRILISRICQGFGIQSLIKVFHSGRLSSPIAFSNRRLCLPEKVLDGLNHAQKEGVLAHELAHIQRKDPGWLVLTNIITHFFFFQPLNRLVRTQLKAVMEESSDRLAVNYTGDTATFTETLIRVAKWSGKPEMHYALGLAAPSNLSKRVNALLDEKRDEGKLGRGWLSIVILLLIVLTSFISPGFSSKPNISEESPVLEQPVDVSERSEFVPTKSISPKSVEAKAEVVREVREQPQNMSTMALANIPKLTAEGPRGESVNRVKERPITADSREEVALLEPKDQESDSKRPFEFVNYDAFKRDFWPMLINSGLLKPKGRNTAELTYDALIVNSRRVSNEQLQQFRQLIEVHFDQGYWQMFQYKRERFKVNAVKDWLVQNDIGLLTSTYTQRNFQEVNDRRAEMDAWAAYRQELAKTLVQDGILKSEHADISVKWRDKKVFINRKRFTGERFIKYRAIKDKYFPPAAAQ